MNKKCTRAHVGGFKIQLVGTIIHDPVVITNARVISPFGHKTRVFKGMSRCNTTAGDKFDKAEGLAKAKHRAMAQATAFVADVMARQMREVQELHAFVRNEMKAAAKVKAVRTLKLLTP